MRILVPFIAVGVPLLITPNVLFHFDITPKIVIFLLGIAFLLILCIWRVLRRASKLSSHVPWDVTLQYCSACNAFGSLLQPAFRRIGNFL